MVRPTRKKKKLCLIDEAKFRIPGEGPQACSQVRKYISQECQKDFFPATCSLCGEGDGGVEGGELVGRVWRRTTSKAMQVEINESAGKGCAGASV